MSKMELNTLAMRAARASNARHASDTGSSEVQGTCFALQQRVRAPTSIMRSAAALWLGD